MVKKLEEYKWMCPEPFMSSTSWTDGTYRPCCDMYPRRFSPEIIKLLIDSFDISTEDIQDLKESQKTSRAGEVMAKVYKKYIPTISTHTFSEYFESDYHKLAKQLFVDERLDILKETCSGCILAEKSGIKSRREVYTSKLGPDFKKEVEQTIHNYIEDKSNSDVYDRVDVTALVGNICNLSCSMCSSGSSSKYYSEAIKLGESNDRKSIIKSRIRPEVIDDLIKNVLPKTRQMKITGGEPLLSKDFMSLLKKLPTELKNRLQLVITSNLTIDPTEICELIKDFESVEFRISVEGVGEVNDYIRYPSNWNTLLEYCNIIKMYPNITANWSTTVNALNIGHSWKLLELQPDYVSSVAFGSIVTNNFYSINSIPNDIKNKYLNRLYGLGRKYPDTIRFIKLLENAEYNEKEMQLMLAHCRRRDIARGTNLLDVFPEWKDYYK